MHVICFVYCEQMFLKLLKCEKNNQVPHILGWNETTGSNLSYCLGVDSPHPQLIFFCLELKVNLNSISITPAHKFTILHVYVPVTVLGSWTTVFTGIL